MSSPSNLSSNNDWSIIFDSQNDCTKNNESDGRRILARTVSIPKSMCILSDTKTEISTVSEVISPRLKLPQLGNETTERVFPVRSVVSFDSTPSSALQTPSLGKLESPISPFADAVWTGGTADEKPSNPPPSESAKDTNDCPGVSKRPDYLSRLYQNKETFGNDFISSSKDPQADSRLASDGQPPSSACEQKTLNSRSSNDILSLSTQLRETLREGGQVLATSGPPTGAQYSREDENPITIHPFGALLVFSQSGNDVVAQAASSNSKEIVGYSPDELFALESFCSALPSSQKSVFLTHSRFVLDDDYEVKRLGPEVFHLSITSIEGDTRNFWCTMHTSKAYNDFVICELEPENAAPKSCSIEENESQWSEATKESGLRTSCDQEMLPGSKLDPLGSLASLRSRRWTVESSELLNSIPRVLQRIASAQTLELLVHHTLTMLQQLTQFHRVTMYHFDGDRNGVVVADVVDASLGLDSYEGIRFPESTFPEDLRRQYLRNTVCFSYSKSADPAELVYRASTNKMELDMTHSYMSAFARPSTNIFSRPVHACLSIRINVFGKFWGLVSCQSYDKELGLHPLTQKMCWLIAEAVSSNIERLSYTLPFQIREQSTLPTETGSAQSIETPTGDLLGLFGADYAAASIFGETKILGRPNDSQEVLALLEYLSAKDLGTVVWSTDIPSDFQDLSYSPGFQHLSGLLYIPLSADNSDFIIFFRADPARTGDIGNREEKPAAAFDQHDIPERVPRLNEWSAAEFGKASILSLLYRTFTEIWQENEAAMQNNQLMRLLLANSAHEFRTPLNAIINYLEIALDGTLNEETRENLSRSHSASKSLIYIINDLLDLTNAENGQKLIKDEIFDLSETMCEATDIFWEEARQKHVDLQVVQHSALPPVLGDQRRVRQVITNLISNAIQHTSTGAVTIESCVLSDFWESGHIAVEVAIHDTGSGMSQESVEALFCELEQVSTKGYIQNPKSCGKKTENSTGETKSILGLGLALVARIVRNMSGQLSLKSEQGKGSCFKIRLKFPLPLDMKSGPAAQDEGARSEQEKSQEAETSSSTSKGTRVDNTSAGDRQADNHEDHEPNKQEGEGIVCRCGDSNEYGPSLGEGDRPFLDVDVTLSTGTMLLSCSDPTNKDVNTIQVFFNSDIICTKVN